MSFTENTNTRYTIFKHKNIPTYMDIPNAKI